jgi:flagellar L-ring protein precursor FlgH
MNKFIVLLVIFSVTGCASLVKQGVINDTVEPAAEPTLAANPVLDVVEPILDAVVEPVKPIADAVAEIFSKENCGKQGCPSFDEEVENDPVFAPVEPVEANVNVIPTGSLFQNRYANNLYSDIKAHRVGDIITVHLEESTSAKKQAGTSFDKNNSYSIAIEDTTFPSTSENNGVSIYGGGAEGSQTSSFSGDSGTDQSNSLQGSITVNVTRVLSNGNLEIRGEKWLMLNNGEEFIRIKGVIRSEDVGADNSVSSTHVANSRIQYGGTGDFANTQKQGWLSSYFSKHWPL